MSITGFLRAAVEVFRIGDPVDMPDDQKERALLAVKLSEVAQAIEEDPLLVRFAYEQLIEKGIILPDEHWEDRIRQEITTIGKKDAILAALRRDPVFVGRFSGRELKL